ncbi:MAG TPA: DUF4124 domain-containing protein [Rhodanobacteraceae bacterium]|nr:DUF4124 domain-containing protein [Rhodanobacteraceae bacterium]
MRFVLPAVLALVIAAPAWAAGGSSQPHQRYKWTDGEGNLHYTDALPPEAVKYGYEIVNPQGVVIKHVDRPKTAEEKAAAKAELAKAQAAKESADARARNDKQLLAAYPTEEDLKRAQHQQTEMMDQNLNSARISLQSQEKSLAELLGHAAELDSNGKPVPANLAKKIADMRKQVDEQRTYIGRKQKERDDTVAHFDDDLAHYRGLKEPQEADRR